ncbi:MAG: hypothetical protein OEY18_15585 [Candidatus Aminicenantes bacterium]|nr:hypothetical protein [Candidatus Aminicenantes bacterium]
MKYDLKKISSARCYLDVVKVFIDKVPIQDKEWKEIRKDAKNALKVVNQTFDVINSVTMPRPGQLDPCKGGPILRFVEIVPREMKK